LVEVAGEEGEEFGQEFGTQRFELFSDFLGGKRRVDGGEFDVHYSRGQMFGLFDFAGGEDDGAAESAFEGWMDGGDSGGEMGQMARFFGIYFAGVIEGKDVMGGGETVEAAFGTGKGVDGSAGRVEEMSEDAGGEGFAGKGGSGEVEDGFSWERCCCLRRCCSS